MKKIMLYFIFLIMLIAGCEKESSPMDNDLFPQKVYIVGARDQIVERNINLGNSIDTISISVAVSGSRPLNKDVTVTIRENDDEIALYNQRNGRVWMNPAVLYLKLSERLYAKNRTFYNLFN